jgi:ATP-dependent DNA helicase RecG
LKGFTEENLRKLGFNERQVKAVLYVKEKGKITNKEYREVTGLSDEGARTDLNELVEKRILLAKGSGRNVHYVLR